MLLVPASVAVVCWRLSSGRDALREVAVGSALLAAVAYLQWVLNRIYAEWHPKPSEHTGIQDLEKAYLAWMSDLGEEERRVLAQRLLFHAYRCSPLRPIRNLIARAIVSIVDSTHPISTEHSRIQAEIMACLSAHAALDRRPRPLPLRKRGIGGLEPIRLLGAWLGLSSCLFWISCKLSSISELLQGVMVRLLLSFSLVYLLVWGLGMALVVRASYRDRLRFRVLFIGFDEQPAEHIFELLGSLSGFGELVAAVGNQASAARAFALGALVFVVKSVDFPNMLDAFMVHTDLVVVDGGRPEIASLVREHTSLPQGRCWIVLPKDEPAPAGFVRLSPLRCSEAALMVRLHETSGPDYMKVLGRASPYASWRLGYVVGGTLASVGLGLLPYPSLRRMGCFYIACGLAAIFPRYLGARRRRKVDEHWLRVPRAPRISHWLTHFDRVSKCAIVVAGGLSAFAYVDVFDASSGLPWRAPRVTLAVLSLGVAFFCAQAFFAPGLVRALKWTLDWNFRILILRRNAPQSSLQHKALVMPFLGAYGQVVLIGDRHLNTLRFQGSAAAAHEALAESSYSLSVDDDVDHWQDLILREISSVDVAVFDWTGEVSDNMRWELLAARQRIPANRLLMLCGAHNRATVEGSMHEVDQLLGTAVEVEVLALSLDVQVAAQQLRNALVQMMHGLKVAARS